jgi:hypothetical protein
MTFVEDTAACETTWDFCGAANKQHGQGGSRRLPGGINMNNQDFTLQFATQPKGADSIIPASHPGEQSAAVTRTYGSQDGLETGVSQDFMVRFLDKLREARIFKSVVYEPNTAPGSVPVELVFNVKQAQVPHLEQVQQAGCTAALTLGLSTFFTRYIYDFSVEFTIEAKLSEGKSKNYSAKCGGRVNYRPVAAPLAAGALRSQATTLAINSIVNQMAQDEEILTAGVGQR